MVQAVAYFTGFETGDLSEVAVGDATFSAQATTKRTGGYALKAAAGALTGVILLASASITIASARTYFLFTGTPGGTGAILYLDSTGDTTHAYVYIDASRILHLVGFGGVDTAGTTVLSASTWYRIEFAYNPGSALACWINGVLEIAVGDATAKTITQVTVFRDSAADCYWDDIRIDSGGAAQVGAGQTIARQGIAGTPTYDAWTKNGAATAALCWSETPLATAKNCSSSTASQAQTTLIDKFSTNPGRAVEGTEVVGTLDVINACKVGIVGKTATSSTAAKIRRRVDGTDTDTAITYATSDGFLNDGIWTATPAQLDLLEAGVVHGSDSNLENVEDIWVMVDYTPSGVPWVPPTEYGLAALATSIRRAPAMVAY